MSGSAPAEVMAMDGRDELFATLWRGADVLRSKMDANEYKNYLLGFIFYKYLSDSFLYRVYDLLNDCRPSSMKEAQDAYEEVWDSDDIEELKTELKDSLRYVIDPRLTFFRLAEVVAEPILPASSCGKFLGHSVLSKC